MNKLLVILVTLAMMLGLTAGATADGNNFSLFGDAQSVIGGVGPNNSAIELLSDTSTNLYSGIEFQSPRSLTFAEITELSTYYNVGAGDCGGGSPRFSIGIDMNGDGDFNQPPDGHVFVYIGPYPNFTDCLIGWQTTGNLIENTDLRFDTSQVGGTFYDSYANAVSLVGDKKVLSISLVVDSGWMFPRGQAVQVDNLQINQHGLK